MSKLTVIERRFINAFRRALNECRLITDAYYNSFEYTKTGNNLSHPRTLGLIIKVCWSLPKVAAVDVDCRYNLGNRVKFQPDVSCKTHDARDVLFVDFESPNGSDARIPDKDVDSYCKWSKRSSERTPYFIISSLPRQPDKWQLRYTSAGQVNARHRPQRATIYENPFRYWYEHYRKSIKASVMREFPIRFLNLDGRDVELIELHNKMWESKR